MPYHDEEYPGQPLWQSVVLFCCKGMIEVIMVILFFWLLLQVLFTKQLEGKAKKFPNTFGRLLSQNICALSAYSSPSSSPSGWTDHFLSMLAPGMCSMLVAESHLL